MFAAQRALVQDRVGSERLRGHGGGLLRFLRRHYRDGGLQLQRSALSHFRHYGHRGVAGRALQLTRTGLRCTGLQEEIKKTSQYAETEV